MKYINSFKKFESVTNNIFYHGSNTIFDKFDLVNNKTYKEFDIPCWFFSKDIEYAKTYGKYIYVVNLNIDNTFDLSNRSHLKLFEDTVERLGDDLDQIMDEQFYKDLPYWTCEDAYYSAVENNFDSILLHEDLASEILSIGVFDKSKINILEIKKDQP